MKLIIISGRSGSGKSITLYTFEDLGYYCIDNLPLSLLNQRPLILTPQQDKIAISIDVRNLYGSLSTIKSAIKQIKNQVDDVQIIYFDANDNILLKRFCETRRKHPLNTSSLKEAINTEKKLLIPIAEQADLRIDTSSFSIKKLRETIYQRIYQQKIDFPLLTFQSFSYKKNTPLDSDFIFDARCLPNPYWQPQLRNKTGLDQEVINYFNKPQQVIDFY